MIYNLEKRTLGLNFTTTGTADALVWAPFAGSVSIELHDKMIPLEKTDLGYWKSDSLEVVAGDTYQFALDRKKYPDPASLSQPKDVHGPSEAINLRSYVWTDTEWKGILPEDLIIYELHTGTFTEAGTFEGITGKLGYLKELGITAIEIMPVAQFPGPRNWGYDGVFPFAVQNTYGGAERLQKLVDACHTMNIAVILDVVYNHMGPEGNYLEAFGPYFTEKYKTPWGKAMNFDDEWSDGTRRYFIENALMWFRDFHIDGLRLDAVHAIMDFSANHILAELKENTIALNELSGGNHFLIAESDLNDIRYINPYEKGGYNVDLQWYDEFHHAIHTLVTAESHRYYADFGSIDHLAKAFNDVFVYDGKYSHFRKRTFGNKITDLPGSKFVVFAQNHDQVGNRMLGERLSVMTGFETLKLIAATVILSPYIPLIFMGEEYGETNPFLYFTSHGDEDLINAVREGRNKEFTWADGEVPDPQAESTFKNSRLNWENQSPEQLKLLEFYKELIRLRKTHPVLKSTDRKGLEADVIKDSNAIVLLRQYHENLTICIMNFEDKIVTLEKESSKKSLFILLNSSGSDWSKTLNIVLGEDNITVQPKSVLLLSDIKG